MPKAIRQFTDRTEPQTAFRNAYVDMANHAPEENRSRVITYYGMGGIGKTRLLQQLKENLVTEPACTDKNRKKPLVVYFDFEQNPEDIQILKHLKNILSTEFHWQFPRFELGLYLYGKTIGEDTQAPTAKAITEQRPLLKLLVDIAAELSLFGSLFKVLSYVDQGQAALRNLRKQHAEIAERFEDLTPKEQQAALPGLFAADLNAYTEKAPAPLVFLLDTYERIAESTTQGSALRRDLWLHGEDSLISMTKNALWVIAGRHKIQWEVENCAMEQHLLGSLSDEDAGAFLAGAGIPQDLIPELCKLTGGTPLYLDVCVDQYEQLLRRGEKPELSKFGNSDTTRLIECYLKYMDKSVKELVYMLTFIPQWDEALVRSAAEKVLGGFSLADFKRVKKLSITLPVDQTHYFIHRTVAEVLQKDPENESRESTAKFLIDHFLPVLDTASPYGEAYSNAVTGIMQGGLLLHQDRTALADFYRNTLEKPQNLLRSCRRYDLMKQLFASYWERAEEDPSDFLYASALAEKAWRIYQRNEAKDLATKHDIFAWTVQALRLLQNLNMEDHIEVPRALEALAVYFSNLSYNYPMAVSLYQYAIALCKAKHPHEKIVLTNTRRNLAITHKHAKNYDAAAVLFQENLELAEEMFAPGDLHRLRAMQDMAISYYDQGNLDSALEMGKQALALKTAHLTEKHPDTIKSMITLAGIYHRMGNYTEEATVRENILRVRRKYLAKNHPDIISSISSLAATYKQQRDYPKEAPLREELLERLRAEYTEEHIQTLFAVKNLADVYHNLQWKEKRNALYLSWCSLWAAGNRRMREHAASLTDSACYHFHDYALGKQLCQILLENTAADSISQRPSDVLRLKRRLAKCHFGCGEPQDALAILEDILKTAPEDDPNREYALSDQMEILLAIGQTDRAEQIRQTLSEAELRRVNRLETEKNRTQAPYQVPQPANMPKIFPTPEDFTGLSLQEVLDKVCMAMPPKNTLRISHSEAAQMSLKELMDLVRQNQQAAAQANAPK